MKRFTVALLLALGVGAAWGDIDPFMTEHWNQASPWNDYMPVFSSEAGASDEGLEGYNRRAPAGCVAIQMAQFLHYWQWPKTYWNLGESTHSVTQTYGKEPYSYTIALHPSGRSPFDYGSGSNSMARLAFVCASLADMGFTSNGSGSLPETVFKKLINSGYYECGESVIKDPTRMKRFLEASYPLLARGEGHAYLLHGWKDDSKTPVFANWGWPSQKGDTWKTLDQIDDIFLCYPKIMPRIDSVPTYVKRPLTITWGFPETYCTIYKDNFDGFNVNIVPTKSQIKDDPGVTEKVDASVREFTFSKESLENGKEYRVTVTPIFKGETLSTIYSHSVEFTVSDSAPELPKILTSPTDIKVKLRQFAFAVTCSDAVNSLEVSPSVYSINLKNDVYCFDFDNLTCTKNGNTYTISINAGILPQQFEDQKLILTLKANGSYAEDYKDVIVTLLPNDGEESGLEDDDPATPPTEPDNPEPEKPETLTNFVNDSENPDYILISPSGFVSAWTEYVKARAVAHPKIKFAIKDAAEIYAAYKDLNPSEKIKEYIRSQAQKGTKYFVLGGAWSNIGADGKCEENFVVAGENGDKYSQLALSLDNTIPGFFRTFSGKTLATDYPYSLIDGDEKADVVVARIPLVPWSKANGTVPTFAAMIEGYGKKVAAVESDDFSGRHRYACAAGQLGSNVARGSGYWPTERHAYADGYYDFFDPKHPDSATDGEIAARRRFRDYFAMNNPIYGAMVVPQGNSAADFFADTKGWEAIVAKCHGLEGEAYGTGINDSSFRETKNLVKFGIFAMPCLTGRPDRTTTWNGWENMRLPSMGVAAICNPEGGEVVGFHNTHDGAGKNDVALVTTCGDPYATQYEKWLLEALCVKRLNAGEAWLQAHNDYIDKNGTGIWHLWTAYEALLYGDPLVEPSAVGADEKVCGKGTIPSKVLFR